MNRKNLSGFTLIELLVVITVATGVAVLLFTNLSTIRAENRDEQRKTDINSIYYQLEALREETGSYPEKITAESLKGINPDSLKDTNGIAIGEEQSEYVYTPKNCKESKCTGYSLETNLEREANFTKESLRS